MFHEEGDSFTNVGIHIKPQPEMARSGTCVQ